MPWFCLNAFFRKNVIKFCGFVFWIPTFNWKRRRGTSKLGAELWLYFRGQSWLSYDNERSIALKTQFGHDLGLAGVMTWSIETDDFLGICNKTQFPLLRTINQALFRRERGMRGVYTTTATTITTITATSDTSGRISGSLVVVIILIIFQIVIPTWTH